MMHAYLHFRLSGDIAMWRNPFEPVGSFSALGPAPSQIAGLVGAALGMPSPRSQAGRGTLPPKALERLRKRGLPWPVSPELLQWQLDNDYAVACRWLGGIPKRIPWHVNATKEVKNPLAPQPLRLQQQVIDRPAYQVLVRLKEERAATDAAACLMNPAFPLYLGASFCRAVVRNVAVCSAVPCTEQGASWTYHKERLGIGESVPFSRHVINAQETAERIHADGFWVYPTPMHGPEKQPSGDPCTSGYCILQLDGPGD